jgi:hypothetical protein
MKEGKKDEDDEEEEDEKEEIKLKLITHKCIFIYYMKYAHVLHEDVDNQ